MLGDNIYGDTRDMAVLAAKYRMLGDKPGFQRIRSRLRTLAIWDDHDFGEDDAGGDYPFKHDSQRIFCDFWGEAPQSPRRSRDGIYTSYLFGSAPRRVQVIMPDLRFNRTPLKPLDLGGRDYEERAKEWAEVARKKGGFVPGPYDRIPDRDATMLGEAQWRWLEAQLQVPAEVRILASSLQVVADFAGWEGWINYAHDHQRLVSLIRRHHANGLVCISGDTHYAEYSRLDANTPYPLWDITSSGLTEVWPVLPPNALRGGEVLREPHFGLLEIDWSGPHPLVIARIRDIAGKLSLEQRIDTGALIV
jgi:alkaline phosphatase D